MNGRPGGPPSRGRPSIRDFAPPGGGPKRGASGSGMRGSGMDSRGLPVGVPKRPSGPPKLGQGVLPGGVKQVPARSGLFDPSSPVLPVGTIGSASRTASGSRPKLSDAPVNRNPALVGPSNQRGRGAPARPTAGKVAIFPGRGASSGPGSVFRPPGNPGHIPPARLGPKPASNLVPDFRPGRGAVVGGPNIAPQNSGRQTGQGIPAPTAPPMRMRQQPAQTAVRMPARVAVSPSPAPGVIELTAAATLPAGHHDGVQGNNLPAQSQALSTDADREGQDRALDVTEDLLKIGDAVPLDDWNTDGFAEASGFQGPSPPLHHVVTEYRGPEKSFDGQDEGEGVAPHTVIPASIRSVPAENPVPRSSYAASPIVATQDSSFWFFPDLGRSDAEARLQASNSFTFLVRSSSIANAYALSKFDPETVVLEHLLIQQVAGGKWHLEDTDDANYYKSLEDLVEYTPYLQGYGAIGGVEDVPPPPPQEPTDDGLQIGSTHDSAGLGFAISEQPLLAPDDSWMPPLIMTQNVEYLIESIDFESPAVEDGKPKLIDADANTAYYDALFFGNPHYIFVGKVPPAIDAQLGLELVIVCMESFSSSKTHEVPTQLRALVKSKLDEHWVFVDFQKLLKHGGGKKAIAKCLKEAMGECEHDEVLKLLGSSDKFSLVLAADESEVKSGTGGPFSTALVTMERMVLQTGYKFGVLYTRAGQTTEDEFFSNREEECSVYFNSFLDLLGDRIRLQGWDKYRGGLNVRDDSTGTHSVFTVHEGVSIMFHVAPLLPYQDDDIQRIEKKRHLGNDVVMIVFRDPDETTSFDPSMIKSEFNHVFLVVQPVAHPGVTPSDPSEVWYRLSVATRDATVPVKPTIPAPAVFRHTEHLQYWILSKLVNGERNAMNNMTRFKKKMQETKMRQMQMLVDEHTKKK